MHKSAVLCGLACLGLSATRLSFTRVILPLGAATAISAVAYDISWQRDPMCKYQVRILEAACR
jgi:hypothetical protein